MPNNRLTSEKVTTSNFQVKVRYKDNQLALRTCAQIVIGVRLVKPVDFQYFLEDKYDIPTRKTV